MAEALQAALQRFAKRWYQRRALRVFRDDASLENNEALWRSLADALDVTDSFILLASPASARSPWIPREVRHWRASHPHGRLLVVQTGGEIVREPDATDYDWQRTTALPRALADEFAGGPRYTDLRWAHEAHGFSLSDRRVLEDVADIAAPLHSSSKEEMISRDAAEHRRTKRVIAGVATVLAVLAATATVFGVLAQRASHRAQREARVALARQLAAQSRVALGDDRPDLALLLAVRAGRTDATGESRDALLAALNGAPQLRRVITAAPAQLAAPAADGRSMVTLGDDGVLRRFDLRSDRVAAAARRVGAATGLAANGAGRLVALGRAGGHVTLLDLGSGRRTDLGSGGPDVTHLAFAAHRPVLAWNAGRQVGLWVNGTTRRLDAPYSPEDLPWKVAVSADGRSVAAVGGEDARVVLWRIDSAGRPGSPHLLPAGAGVAGLRPRDVKTQIALSTSDPSLLAVARSDGAVALVGTASGRDLRLLRGGRGRIEHIAFSPDGRRLVAAHEGGVDAWNVATGERLPGHASPFSSDLAVGMTEDGIAAGAGSIGTVALLDVQDVRHRLARTLPGAQDGFDTVVASPDGRRVMASSLIDPGAQVWGIGATAPRALATRDPGPVLHFDAAGAGVIECCGDDFEPDIQIDNLRKGTVSRIALGSEVSVDDATVTRAGRAIAIGTAGNAVIAFDPRRTRAARRLAGARGGEPALISADGRWAAVVVRSATGIWGTADGRARGRPTAGRPLAFSPDGLRLAVAGEASVGGFVRLARTRTGHMARSLRTRQPAIAAAFAPDGRTLAVLTQSPSLTAPSNAYAVELWDPVQGTRVGTEDLVAWNASQRVALAPSIAFRAARSGPPQLVVGGLEPQPLAWTLDVKAWWDIACQVVGRDLTPKEWRQYVGQSTQRPTCPPASPAR